MTATRTAPDRTRRPVPTGYRRGTDIAYTLLASLFVVAVLVQVFLAGAGAFAHHSGTHAVQHPFSAHETLGNILGIAAVVLLVLALVAHVDRITMIAALVLAVLTEVAQHGLAQAGHDNRWVGGVHAFDGMLILLLASWLAIGGYRRRAVR